MGHWFFTSNSGQDRDRQIRALLLIILLLAIVVRVWGISYGLPCPYCRPDEDRLINTALRLSLKDLNPHIFNWPSLFFYLTRGILEIYATLLSWLGLSQITSLQVFYQEDPSHFHLLLRIIFCGLGVASVYLLYRLGKKVFSDVTGLLAAFFFSLSFLHARESHFAMLDIPVTFFSLVFFLETLKIYRQGNWSNYIRIGLIGGLAVATKLYACLLITPLFVAHFLGIRSSSGNPRIFVRLLISLFFMIVIFLMTSPYVVLDFNSFLRSIQNLFLEQFSLGNPVLPEVVTYRGYWYHLFYSFRYALGWPLELVCLLGLIWMIYRNIQKREISILIITFVLSFYMFLSLQKNSFMRYTIMLLPYLCLMAAHFLEQVRRKLSSYGMKWLYSLFVVLLVLEPAWQLVQHNICISRRDSRNIASQWITNNIPNNAGLLFPDPLIFGRPWATFRYAKRISFQKGESVEVVKNALPELSRSFKYVVIDRHPIAYSSVNPDIKRLLKEESELIYRLEAFRENPSQIVFETLDAYYVPLAGFQRVKYPGPTIEIYKLP